MWQDIKRVIIAYFAIGAGLGVLMIMSYSESGFLGGHKWSPLDPKPDVFKAAQRRVAIWPYELFEVVSGRDPRDIEVWLMPGRYPPRRGS